MMKAPRAYGRLERAATPPGPGARGRGPRLALLLSALVSALLMAAGGCGYHIAGKSGEMPGGIRSVSIPVFVNSTTKPDIEGIMTRAFVSEFVTTLPVKDEADAVLSGRIVSYAQVPVSFTSRDVAQEYRLTVVVSITLRRRSDSAVLWEDRGVRDYEDYRVDTSNVTRTEEEEIRVFRKLSRDMARLVKERMLEGF